MMTGGRMPPVPPRLVRCPGCSHALHKKGDCKGVVLATGDPCRCPYDNGVSPQDAAKVSGVCATSPYPQNNDAPDKHLSLHEECRMVGCECRCHRRLA